MNNTSTDLMTERAVHTALVYELTICEIARYDTRVHFHPNQVHLSRCTLECPRPHSRKGSHPWVNTFLELQLHLSNGKPILSIANVK